MEGWGRVALLELMGDGEGVHDINAIGTGVGDMDCGDGVGD